MSHDPKFEESRRWEKAQAKRKEREKINGCAPQEVEEKSAPVGETLKPDPTKAQTDDSEFVIRISSFVIRISTE